MTGLAKRVSVPNSIPTSVSTAAEIFPIASAEAIDQPHLARAESGGKAPAPPALAAVAGLDEQIRIQDQDNGAKVERDSDPR